MVVAQFADQRVVGAAGPGRKGSRIRRFWPGAWPTPGRSPAGWAGPRRWPYHSNGRRPRRRPPCSRARMIGPVPICATRWVHEATRSGVSSPDGPHGVMRPPSSASRTVRFSTSARMTASRKCRPRRRATSASTSRNESTWGVAPEPPADPITKGTPRCRAAARANSRSRRNLHRPEERGPAAQVVRAGIGRAVVGAEEVDRAFHAAPEALLRIPVSEHPRRSTGNACGQTPFDSPHASPGAFTLVQAEIGGNAEVAVDRLLARGDFRVEPARSSCSPARRWRRRTGPNRSTSNTQVASVLPNSSRKWTPRTRLICGGELIAADRRSWRGRRRPPRPALRPRGAPSWSCRSRSAARACESRRRCKRSKRMLEVGSMLTTSQAVVAAPHYRSHVEEAVDRLEVKRRDDVLLNRPDVEPAAPGEHGCR